MSLKTNKSFSIGLIIGAAILVLLLFIGRKVKDTSPTETTSVSESQSQENTFQTVGTPGNDSAVAEKPAPATDLALPEDQQKKWQVFNEILVSRNDNDPRIDKELKDLPAEFHQKLENNYENLVMEKRSERGFIVFLIARDLKSPEDARFLKKVFSEPPCFGFEKCETPGPPDAHHDSINEVSLNYPQLAGIYQIEKRLDSNPSLLQDPTMREEIRVAVREAMEFPNPSVRRKAEDVLKKFSL